MSRGGCHPAHGQGGHPRCLAPSFNPTKKRWEPRVGKQRPPQAALALASTDVLWDLAALLSPWAMGAPGWPLHQLQRGKLSWKAHPRKATKRGIRALNKHPTFSRAGIWLSMQAIVVAWHVNVPCSLSRTVPGWVSPGRWPRSPTRTGAHRGALKPSPCCHNPPAVGHTGGAGGAATPRSTHMEGWHLLHPPPGWAQTPGGGYLGSRRGGGHAVKGGSPASSAPSPRQPHQCNTVLPSPPVRGLFHGPPPNPARQPPPL